MAGSGKNIWRSVPFFKILCAFSTGIVIQSQLEIALYYLVTLFFLSILVFVCSGFISLEKRFRLKIVQGLLGMMIFLCLGAICLYCKNPVHHNNWFPRKIQDRSILVARLMDAPSEGKNSYRVIANVEQVINPGARHFTSGKVLIYLKKFRFVAKLKPGTELEIFSNTQNIPGAINPGAFDYRRYCELKGIRHQLFLDSNDFIITGHHRKQLDRLLDRCSEYVLHTIRRYIPDRRNQGLAEALLIGYKEDLDRDLVQSYTNTGVVHIIAISGLHVGLIYWLLLQLCRPLQKLSLSKWVNPLIIIAGLWFFTLLAGAQASVLRSTIMFTSIVLERTFSRSTTTMNSLAMSAFVILLINPYWLWDIGFQLSYAAVFGILAYTQSLYGLFTFRSRWLDMIWKMTTVTLAAQIITTPLCIFYFHQFPVFFLITNLLAVPLSTAILFAIILLMSVGWINPAGILIGKITGWLIDIMNWFIERVAAGSMATWQHLFITAWQTFFLLFFALLLSFGLSLKKKTSIFLSLVSLLIFMSLRFVSFYHSSKQKFLIVYMIPHRSAIEIVTGRKYERFYDSLLANERSTLVRYTGNTHTIYRIWNKDPANQMNQVFMAGNLRCWILDYSYYAVPSLEKTRIDILMLCGNARVNFKYLLERFEIKQVVVDASLSPFKVRQWKTNCDSAGIRFHDVSISGAFVKYLP